MQHAPDLGAVGDPADISEPELHRAGADFILEQRRRFAIFKVVNLRSAPGFKAVSEDLTAWSPMRSEQLAGGVSPTRVKLMVVTRNPEVYGWCNQPARRAFF